MSISTLRIVLVGLLFFPQFLFCQVSDTVSQKNDLQEELKKYKNKEVTLIGYNWIGANSNTCPQKAIRINISGVIIDTCYSLKTREVSEDICQNIESNSFYIDIIKMSRDEIVNLREELNAFEKEECDESAKPFIIIVDEKGKESTYGLRRFLHCFPKEAEDFMENMEKLFKSIP